MQDRFRVRAWDKKNKKYIYDIQNGGEVYDYHSGHTDYLTFNEFLESDNFIKQQCTGLRDIKGKTIYEGDILQSADGFFLQKYKIEWDREFSQFTLIGINTINTAFGIIDPDSLKIIGNIHENPELLEA